MFNRDWAVNVKDYRTYAQEIELADAYELLEGREIEALYEARQEDFWAYVNEVARTHGYETAYSEGRMGGWVVPEPITGLKWRAWGLDEMSDDMLAELRSKHFEPFKRDTLELMRACQEDFVSDVQEAAEEAKQAKRNTELAVRGWRY